MQHNSDTIIGTVAGTALAVSSLPTKTDFQNTIILAVVGAITSYLVTVSLKKIVAYIKKRANEKNK
jgi:hypothetical protein